MEDFNTLKSRRNPQKSHPYTDSSFFSKISYTWMFPLFIKGFKNDLGEDDIYPHLQTHDSTILGDRLESQWEKEINKEKKNPSLWKALGCVFGKELFILGVCYLVVEIFVRLAVPLLLQKLLQYYELGSAMPKSEAYWYAMGIVCCSLVSAVFQHTYMLHTVHLGIKIRVATSAVIYRKGLKLNKSALTETTVGQMVNLLSNDVGRFELATTYFHNLWLAPVETVIVLILIYFYVGLTGTVGVMVIILFIPFQMWLGKKISVYRLATATKTDQRIRLMNEIISGIQVIKMYTWETYFAKLVEFRRRKEMDQIKNMSIIRAIMMSFSSFLNSAAIYLCIASYVISGNILDVQYVYVLQSFYGILRINVTLLFPQGVRHISEAHVSVRRIKQFLLYDEIDLNSTIHYHHAILPNIDLQRLTNKAPKLEELVGVHIQNVSINWHKMTKPSTLNNLNIDINSNELAIVIGPVGSGKSTILHAILGEFPPVSGTIKVNGKMSYVSQEPWLFVGSIRQNITFGQKFNETKYHEVIRVCQLQKDFALLPYGDSTAVGTRGVSLSAGQRARINLARAVYSDSDIYLLDDPLSSVDFNVGKQIFEECIRGYLKEKCVLLVTHQLHYLGNVKKIYLLDDGKIDPNGIYHEVQSSSLEIGKPFGDLKVVVDEKDKREDEIKMMKLDQGEFLAKRSDQNPPVEKEGRRTGAISWDVYKLYLNSDGYGCKTLALFVACVVVQALTYLMEYFLKTWVNMNQLNKSQDVTTYPEGKNFNPTSGTTPVHNIITEFDQSSFKYFCPTDLVDGTPLNIFSALLFVLITLTIGTTLAFYRFCNKASIRLHNNMFYKILHTTMRFFNANPSGRILNRFSKDMNQVDEILPFTLWETLRVALTVTAISTVVAIENPWMLLATFVMLTIFYYIRVIFLATSRNIKRLEGISRSPLYSHATTSLQGLITIRTLGAQRILREGFDNYQNIYSSTCFMFLGATRTFGFWLDMHCVAFVSLVTLSFLIFDTETLGGNVGLAITQSLNLTRMFQWGMRQWSELENTMICVERIKEYTDVVSEDDAAIQYFPKSWPNSGSIKFHNLSLIYAADEPYVLKNLTFAINSREKVGIVGRTGAGKSSIISALFRLAINEGRIAIDNVDIARIPLKILRSSFSIIPQEPVLFFATIRKNLDPFDDYSDEVLWSALEDTQLKSAVADLPEGLESMVSEGGSNFSVGQKQLICLARAIIRNNKILILDEATANIDPQTDALIQKTLRIKFANCTVLTITHRLHAIMDSDKIMVMEAGNVVEFGHPHNLLQNKNSMFYKLMQQGGKPIAETQQVKRPVVCQ